LINIDGQVIGISTWIASPSGGSVGLGFAIPVNNAKKAINDFITKGKGEYGWLGVNIENVPRDNVASMKLTDAKGAIVYGVFKSSPADKAGLLPGDFITRFNGEAVENTNELLMMVGNLAPGKRAEIDLVRQGEPRHISVNIKTRADDIILKVNRTPVSSMLNFYKIFNNSSSKEIMLNISRQNNELIIGLIK